MVWHMMVGMVWDVVNLFVLNATNYKKITRHIINITISFNQCHLSSIYKWISSSSNLHDDEQFDFYSAFLYFLEDPHSEADRQWAVESRKGTIQLQRLTNTGGLIQLLIIVKHNTWNFSEGGWLHQKSSGWMTWVTWRWTWSPWWEAGAGSRRVMGPTCKWSPSLTLSRAALPSSKWGWFSVSSVLFNPYNNNSFLKLSMTFSSGGIPCVCVVPGYDGDRELIQCH